MNEFRIHQSILTDRKNIVEHSNLNKMVQLIIFKLIGVLLYPVVISFVFKSEIGKWNLESLHSVTNLVQIMYPYFKINTFNKMSTCFVIWIWPWFITIGLRYYQTLFFKPLIFAQLFNFQIWFDSIFSFIILDRSSTALVIFGNTIKFQVKLATLKKSKYPKTENASYWLILDPHTASKT